MINDILEKKLIDAGLAEAGHTLFRNSMPAEIRVGIMSRNPLAGIMVDPNIEGWYKPNVQIIIRHTNPVLGLELCDDVTRCLLVESLEHHEPTDEHGACHITLFYPRQLPIQFPRLESNCIEWSLNFTTAFGLEPSWRT